MCSPMLCLIQVDLGNMPFVPIDVGLQRLSDILKNWPAYGEVLLGPDL